jgi:zinc protease
MMKTMRTIPAVLAILAFVLLAGGMATAKQPWDKIKIPPLNTFEMPAYERVELPNGMVLYLAEDDFLPLIELSAQIRVGSIYEPPHLVGLASMTGSVLRTGGAGDRSGDAIDELVEDRGLQLNTWVGQTIGGAYLNCLVEDLDLGLDLLADILLRPQFAEDKLELAKQEQKAGISRRNDEPMQIAMREAPKVLYGADHPLARHPEYDTIDAVTREDLQAFHARYFHPDRTHLVVIGNFDTATMVERIERVFSAWPRSTEPLPPDPEIPMLPRTVNVAAKSGLTQATVLLGHRGIRNDHPDYAAIRVAAEILGGGFNSRLFKEIRSKRGLAYSVGAGAGTGWRFPGTFMAYTMTKNADVESAAQAILEEIDRMLAEPVSTEELQLARDSILNSEIFDYDSKRKILDRLVLFELNGYDPDFLKDYQAAVRQLTPADIQAAVNRVWKPADLTFLIVGTPEEFDGDFSRFGAVNEIDITIPPPSPKLEIPDATPESLARGKELMKQLRDLSGGAKAFAGLKSWHEESAMTLQTPMGSFDITLVRTVQLPDRMHLLTKTPFGDQGQVLSGDKGWTTGMQAQDMSEDQVAEARASIHQETLGILRRVDELEFQAIDTMEVAGRTCDPVVVRFKDKATIMFLDAETGRLVMVQSPGMSMMGAPVTQKVFVESYQQFGGFDLPHMMTIRHDDEDFATVEVMRFDVNPEIDQDLFKK